MEQSIASWLLPALALIVGVAIGFLLARLLPGAAHLVEQTMRDGLSFEEAARRRLNRLQGSQAVVLMNRCQPDRLIAARIGNAGGVTIGLGDGEMFLASDMPAILDYTRKVVFLESRQMAIVLKDGFQIWSLDGDRLEVPVHNIPYDPASAATGEYRHFMQKEIHEQVRSLTDTIGGRVDFEAGRIVLSELNLTQEYARRIKKITITACGTAAHAGMVGKVLIEHIARIPVELDIASEFRYRDPILDSDSVVLAISQSGETADTLAAMEEARTPPVAQPGCFLSLATFGWIYPAMNRRRSTRLTGMVNYMMQKVAARD